MYPNTNKTYVPSFKDQVEAYYQSGLNLNPSETVYGIWFGLHDVSEMTEGKDKQELGFEQIAECVGQTLRSINKVFQANKFLVFNIPPLEYMPYYYNTEQASNKSQAAIEINRMLEKDVSNINKHHHALEMDLVDIHSLVNDIVVDPFIFNYKYATTSIITDCVKSGEPCSSSDGYIWWDDTHFSTAFHATIAASIVESESFTPNAQITKEPNVHSERFSIEPSKGIIDELETEKRISLYTLSTMQIPYPLNPNSLPECFNLSHHAHAYMQLHSSQSETVSASLLPASFNLPYDNDFLFDDLSTGFCKTHLNPETPIDEERELNNKSPISLVEMLRHFPDLPSFISHSEFHTFSRLWFNFQKHIMLAKEPEHRPNVQAWLQSSITQINYTMMSIAKSHSRASDDSENVSRNMFSAFRQLKDHMDVVYQVFQIIENGRIWFNQSPLQAIAPLVDSIIKSKQESREVKSNLNPFVPIQDHLAVLASPDKVLFGDLTDHDLSSYSLLSSSQADASQVDNRICIELDEKGDTSFVQCATPAAQVHNINEPLNQLPFTAPSLILSQNAPAESSTALLPLSEQSEYRQSTSFSDTTLWAEGCPLTTTLNTTQCAPVSSSSQFLCCDPNNVKTYTDSKPQDEEHTSDMEELDKDEEYISPAEDEDEVVYGEMSQSDSDLTISKDKKSTANRKSGVRLKGQRSSSRRTATSYDERTTHYLKSIFYDIYSVRDRLTKEQRKQIQKETGLKPRNITYWFSNHKRRFQHTLSAFKQTIKESNGKVKTYEDFLKWERDHSCLEDLSEKE
ncbi:hypothetical protein G6F33_011308 [Rhizopus arrhizus]|nr:hypothetical protein G6F24_010966 [Rhizopus arrhizus]KAG0906524.1 hypothetical protein G6F33_011308 [Rhizopus arrhizus]KAG0936932.1 hypothetical protein G6F32_009946 [Rhizopus arrhizus]